MTVTGGTYTLVIDLDGDATIDVGALGRIRFEAGRYAYVGSALGPGGFVRIDRHRDVAADRNPTRHWHVDHLLGHPAARMAVVVRSPGVAAECAVSRAIEGDRIEGFGASDCGCHCHLSFDRDRDRLVRSVRAAHRVAEPDRSAGRRDTA